jgi:hypothetical protein
VQQYSFDVQRDLGHGYFIDAGYFGAKGTHLWGEPDINELPPGYADSLGLTDPTTHQLTSTTDPKVNAYRPYRGYRAINVYTPAFDSRYNSLQTRIQKRFTRNGFFNANYTLAKTLTNAGSNAATPQNTYNPSGDRGHSPYDRNHVFSASYSYELPFLLHSNAFLRNAVGGWQLSGIFSAASGLWAFNPSNSTNGLDPGGLGILGSGSGATARGDFVCDPNKNAPHTLAQWFNTSCLVNVPAGLTRPGNAARNGVLGPGYWKIDFSMFKNFHLTEKTNLQFRAESFNTLNHTNWSSISSSLGSSTYGQVTGARDARIIQFGLKLSY